MRTHTLMAALLAAGLTTPAFAQVASTPMDDTMEHGTATAPGLNGTTPPGLGRDTPPGHAGAGMGHKMGHHKAWDFTTLDTDADGVISQEEFDAKRSGKGHGKGHTKDTGTDDGMADDGLEDPIDDATDTDTSIDADVDAEADAGTTTN